VLESQNRVVMVETDVITDPDGIALRQEKETVEIDCGRDGSMLKREKDVI
jgi:hypothetical protein